MKLLAYVILCLLCMACATDGIDGVEKVSFGGTDGASSSLTEQGLLNYLKLYKQLKKNLPDELEGLNEEMQEGGSSNEFGSLKQTIEESGITYSDFVRINAGVGTIFSLAEYDLKFYHKLAGTNLEQMEEMVTSIQEMIDNPDVPASEKAGLKKSLQDAKSGKAALVNMWKKNEKKAIDQIKRVKKKLKSIASQNDIDLVVKYKKEISEAYSGISRPVKMQETQEF